MNWRRFDVVLDELNNLRESREQDTSCLGDTELYLDELAMRIAHLQSELCQVRYMWEKSQLEAMKANKAA